MTDDANIRAELLEFTSNVICSYVSNNPVASADLPAVIGDVFGTLSGLGKPVVLEVDLTPAVPIKKSVTKDAIICLECGKRQKMLKRHLFTAHGITPDEYRSKWSLGYDYPMIAATYAAKRQEIAKQIGLGRKKPGKPAPKRGRKKA
jgi:predicted transcriptional regulator